MLSKGRREDGEVDGGDDDSRPGSQQASPIYLSSQVREAKDNPVGTAIEARSARISRPARHQLAPGLLLFCMGREIFLTQNSRETALGGPDASMPFPRRVMNCAVGSGIVADGEKSLSFQSRGGASVQRAALGGNAISRTCPRSTPSPTFGQPFANPSNPMR